MSFSESFFSVNILNNMSDNYISTLLAQCQDNLHICPNCFRDGTRKKFCCNLVVLKQEKVLVCCYIGDKYSISKEAFDKKVLEMKNRNPRKIGS